MQENSAKAYIIVIVETGRIYNKHVLKQLRIGYVQPFS